MLQKHNHGFTVPHENHLSCFVRFHLFVPTRETAALPPLPSPQATRLSVRPRSRQSLHRHLPRPLKGDLHPRRGRTRNSSVINLSVDERQSFGYGRFVDQICGQEGEGRGQFCNLDL